jgi:hypothetical protein
MTQCTVCHFDLDLEHAGLCGQCGGRYHATTDCNAENISHDGGLTYQIAPDRCANCAEGC